MKRLLLLVVLCITLLLSCTKPLDNIVILGVKDKSTTVKTTLDTTHLSVDTTSDIDTTTESTVQITTFTLIDGERVLIINKASKKIHLSFECSYAGKILEENKTLASFDQLYIYLQNKYE